MAQEKLYDPFFKRGGINKIGKLISSSDVDQIYSNVLKDPQFLKSPDRNSFYMGFPVARDSATKMRRRAYEFAYMEFKKRIVEGYYNGGPGISEPGNGNNLGYLQVTGRSSGSKGNWGGAFVTWCYYNAGLRLPNSSKKGNLERTKTWRNICDPVPKKDLGSLQPGDIVCFGDSDYVGIFSKWIDPPGKDGYGLFSVIEGNSSLDNRFKIIKYANGRYDREAIKEINPKHVAARMRLYPTEKEDAFDWFFNPLKDPDLYDIGGYPNTGGTHDPNRAGNRIWQNCWALDMYCNEGTPVYACMDGIVASAGEGSGGRFAGSKVGVVGTGAAKGYLSYSTHMMEIFVNEGDTVSKGQKIGLSGSANGVAHLHFAMAKGTSYTDTWEAGVDPELYIKSSSRNQDNKPKPVTFYRLTKTSLSESDIA